MNKKGETGAVTEEDFEEAFSLTPDSNIENVKEFKNILSKINVKLNSEDWFQRVEFLKLMRSVVKNNQVATKDEILANIKPFDASLKGCVSDLRSQVVREACFTVAFLTFEFGSKLESFLECLMESLINLVPNGTKIMSTSGKVALRYIVNFCQSSKLLPFFTSSLTSSKSTQVRQFSSELMKIICEKWSSKCLDKHSSNIAEAIKKGIYDADEHARAYSREAFCWFHSKFPSLSNQMLNNFDSIKQKAMQRELEIFINNVTGDDYVNPSLTNNKDTFKKPKLVPNQTKSRIDTGNKSKIQSGRTPTTSSKVNTYDSRGRRIGKVTQSQLKEGLVLSHGNKLEELTVTSTSAAIFNNNNTTTVDLNDLARTLIRPGLRIINNSIESTTSTRESSPSSKVSYTNGTEDTSRNTASAFQRKAPGGQYSSLRSKNSEVTDKLNRHKQNSASPNPYNDSFQSDDNMSETSSVSDRMLNLNEILPLLTNKYWKEREKGLQKIERFLKEGLLKPNEKKLLIGAFNNSFVENQSPVIKALLKALYEFVNNYPDDIIDWTYNLLVRLLNMQSNDRPKTGKLLVHKVLMLLIERCGAKVMFDNCNKYITDRNHDPTTKVKLSLLEYMKNILTVAPPSILDNNFSGMLANIVTWSSDTKSPDLRKMSSNIIVKLFDLNSSQFTNNLKTMSKKFQERAHQILNAYMITVNRDENLTDSPTNTLDNHGYKIKSSTSSHSEDINSTSSSSTNQIRASDNNSPIDALRDTTQALNKMALNCDNFDSYSNISSDSCSMRSTGNKHNIGKVFNTTASATKSKTSNIPNYRGDSYSTRNYSNNHSSNITTISNNQTNDYQITNLIQKPLNSLPHSNYDSNIFTKSNSPNVSASINNKHSNVDNNNNNTTLKETSSSKNNNSNTKYNPSSLYFHSGPVSQMDSHDSSQLPPEEVIPEILKELSNHDDRNCERKACLFKLTQMFLDKTFIDWNEYFNTLLFLLLETMADSNADIRNQALTVLNLLSKLEPARLEKFSQLTVYRVLEAQRDTERFVASVAEECCSTLTQVLPPLTVLQILLNTICNYDPTEEEEEEEEEETPDLDNDFNFPANKNSKKPRKNTHLIPVAKGENPLCLASLKTLLKLLKKIDGKLIESEVESLCRCLSTMINHQDSNVRKETTLCLVQMVAIFGDYIIPLCQLTSSQRRLVEVYIKKNLVI